MEIWKDIKGFEGKYQVSSIGRVKRLTVYVGGISPGFLKRIPERIMKPRICGYYYGVDLWNNNIAYRKYLHKLIAESFIPNPNNYTVVDHIDADKLNNEISNLEWCTQSENVKRSNAMGLRNASKISKDKQDEILRLNDLGKSLPYIAVSVGVCFKTAQRCVLRLGNND